MQRENIKRDGLANGSSTENIGNAVGSKGWANGWNEPEELELRRELGDKHPSWRYRV